MMQMMNMIMMKIKFKTVNISIISTLEQKRQENRRKMGRVAEKA